MCCRSWHKFMFRKLPQALLTITLLSCHYFYTILSIQDHFIWFVPAEPLLHWHSNSERRHFHFHSPAVPTITEIVYGGISRSWFCWRHQQLSDSTVLSPGLMIPVAVIYVRCYSQRIYPRIWCRWPSYTWKTPSAQAFLRSCANMPFFPAPSDS